MKASQKKPLNYKPNFSFLFLPLILFSGFVFWSCNSTKNGMGKNGMGKNGMGKKGTGKIYEPIKAPVAFNFLDANRLLKVQIPSAKVTLFDDGGQVVTPYNSSFKTLEVSGGVLNLGLKQKAEFSAKQPYRFALKIEAPGYSTNYRTIIVSKDTAQYIPIFMAKLDDPPAGMSGVMGNIPIKNSTIQDKVTIVPKTSNEQKRKVRVTLAPGTVLTSNGKKIDGADISYNFSYASPTRIASLRTFPGSAGGTLISDAVDANGKRIATPGNPIYFTTAGWMNLEMKSKDQTVTEFSESAQVIMPIEDKLNNPKTSKPYKAQDEIDIWSLNERGVWKREGTAVIKNSEEGLVAVMNIKHLSDWNLDYLGPNVCASTTINYCNQIVGTPSTVHHGVPLWCEIVETQNGGRSFTSCGAGGRVFNFHVCPIAGCQDCAHHSGTPGRASNKEIINGFSGREAAFVVYNSTSGPTGGILGSSIFTFCPNPAAAPPTLIIQPSLQSVKIKIQKGTTPIDNTAVFFLNDKSCQATPAAYSYGGNLVAGETTLYNSSGNFAVTDIRFAGGSLLGPDTYDFVFDLTPGQNLVQTVPLTVNCMSSATMVECKWFPGPAQFLITIP